MNMCKNDAHNHWTDSHTGYTVNFTIDVFSLHDIYKFENDQFISHGSETLWHVPTGCFFVSDMYI